MPPRIITAAYAALVLTGLAAMGADNANRLARCESAGRSAAECRLVVLGR